MKEFKDILRDCYLRDLDFKGSKYAWCNKRGGLSSISKRLDRFVANSYWCQLFPRAIVIHGTIACSNHLSIWLDSEGNYVHRKGKKNLSNLKQYGCER